MKKFNALFLASLMCLSPLTLAKPQLNPLYVTLSDAMSAVKQQNPEQAKQHLTQLKTDFNAIEGRNVATIEAIDQAIASPNMENLTQVSHQLVAFERAQNPVDYAQKRQLFIKRIMPMYELLEQAAQSGEIDAIRGALKRFGPTWGMNEMAMRETSLEHYGQVEKVMALLRISAFAEQPNIADIQSQIRSLGETLRSFKGLN